ncbi:hypothetical protein OG453_15120 [Streptomyces sp. NBC_01381]|uniref:hypothetical protein n=1 Tax=Streptomyces sp. NBC_01381 TaxID=2903845 RepID=UPI00225AA4ED|nr:hypothetical protein [Streptomyces sp. NBC_01381]MCX4667987.1 hypothetical protein [Streptomyces sp. NBC_01381]
MSRSGRWLLTIVVALIVLALCVWLGDLLLPWDQATRISTGAGAGAVVAGILGAWASSLIGSPAPPAGPAASGPTASGERAVATQDNSGIIITGDNGNVQR